MAGVALAPHGLLAARGGVFCRREAETTSLQRKHSFAGTWSLVSARRAVSKGGCQRSTPPRSGIFRCSAATVSRKHGKEYAEAPPMDGTTRLYYSPMCPYAQRVMIAAKYKDIDLEWVEIDLSSKPAWYATKYPRGQVPALEHNGKVTGESLDLIKYLDEQFDGPKLAPQDPVKKQEAQEFIEYCNKYVSSNGYRALTQEGASKEEMHEIVGPVLDRLEAQLASSAAEGPFFLGEFSSVDVVVVPFLERLQFAFDKFRNFDLFEGYPYLNKWMEAMEQLPFYMDTRVERDRLYTMYKRALESGYFKKIGLTKPVEE